MTTRTTAVMMAAAMMAGCNTAATIRQNTVGINASTDAIRTNSAAIAESTKGTTALIPALDGVNSLRAPLESVAALSPTLQGVANLREPMTRVAALDAPMQSVAALNGPMLRVAALDSTMNAVAGLDGPMRSVAAMRPSLEAVASLRPALDRVSALDVRLAAVSDLSPQLQQVGGLREPLERVAALDEPMSQLAALGSILNRPLLLLGIAVLALAAWGAVTFFAVKLAILSARARAAESRHGAANVKDRSMGSACRTRSGRTSSYAPTARVTRRSRIAAPTSSSSMKRWTRTAHRKDPRCGRSWRSITTGSAPRR